ADFRPGLTDHASDPELGCLPKSWFAHPGEETGAGEDKRRNTMRHSIVGFLALACTFAALSLTPTSRSAHGAEEFRSLFNGKDLAGWDGDLKFWSVKEGAITGMTTPENPTPGNTFLI